MLLREYKYFMDKNIFWFTKIQQNNYKVFDVFKVKLYVQT